MKKVFMHTGIALTCTALGTAIWLYWNNLLFPARPVEVVFDKQVLTGGDMLDPAGMLEDFELLVEIIEDVHPGPYNSVGKDEWDKTKESLRDLFTGPLTASQYYFALNSLVNLVGDAHTILLFEEDEKSLPLIFQWVEEGLVIADNCGEFKQGDLVLQIGDQSPGWLLEQLDGIVSSENIYRVKDQSERNLRRRPILEHLGLVQDESILFTVERNGEILEIAAYFTVRMPGLADVTGELISRRHEWSVDRDNNLGLFNLRVCINDDIYRKDVEEFFDAVRSNAIENVVIDLRENIGGNSGVVESFLRQLPIDSYKAYGTTIRYSKQAAERAGMRRIRGTSTYLPSTRRVDAVENPFGGNIFLLTGNKTFSSGNAIAVVFYDNSLGTVIGEPSGNAPSSFGDMLTFQLPNTKFILGVSYKRFARPDHTNDPQDSLYPHVIISKTRDDVVNGVDPVIEYIMKQTR